MSYACGVEAWYGNVHHLRIARGYGDGGRLGDVRLICEARAVGVEDVYAARTGLPNRADNPVNRKRIVHLERLDGRTGGIGNVDPSKNLTWIRALDNSASEGHVHLGIAELVHRKRIET